MAGPVFQHGKYCYYKGKRHHFRIDGLRLDQVQVVAIVDPSTSYNVSWDPDPNPVPNAAGTALHFVTTPDWDLNINPPPMKAALTVSRWTLILNLLKALFGGSRLTDASDDLTYVSYDEGSGTMTVYVVDPQYYYSE